MARALVVIRLFRRLLRFRLLCNLLLRIRLLGLLLRILPTH
jgi:hypothetical protein